MMEGLIPYVFRVLKRRRTRQHYQRLTLGKARSHGGSFHSHGGNYLMPPPEKLGGGGVHRRHSSAEEFSTRDYYSPENYVDRPRMEKRGSFRMIACISGA